MATAVSPPGANAATRTAPARTGATHTRHFHAAGLASCESPSTEGVCREVVSSVSAARRSAEGAFWDETAGATSGEGAAASPIGENDRRSAAARRIGSTRLPQLANRPVPLVRLGRRRPHEDRVEAFDELRPGRELLRQRAARRRDAGPAAR